MAGRNPYRIAVEIAPPSNSQTGDFHSARHEARISLMERELSRHATLPMNLTALPSQQHVKRALIPVGGRGTRMYPATAAVPKELLAIGNRPLLEFALARAEGAWGVPLSQRRIDCGSPDGYLEAQL